MDEVYKVDDLPKDIREILDIYNQWMNQKPLKDDSPITINDYFTDDFPVRFTRAEVWGYKFILVWADPIKDEGGPQLLVAQPAWWLEDGSISNITIYFDTDQIPIYTSNKLLPQ